MAQTVYTIPLTNVAQRFVIALNGISYTLNNRWNEQAQAWMVDIFDETNTAPLMCGLPLVAGANLLEQHEHLNIGGALVCYTDGDEFAPPTEASLGVESNVYFVVDA